MNTAGAGGTGGRADSARELFAGKLSELFGAAGNPTLETTRRRTVQRVGSSRNIVSIQRISAWRSGENVPDRFAKLEPILVTLLSMARETGSADPARLLTMGTWQQIWRRAREDPPATETIPVPVRDTLPSDVTLVGRVEELERIVRRAATGGVVTVSGMPGVGKTALLIRAAHRLRAEFPGGRLFVDMQAHAPDRAPAAPSDLLATMLAGLGMNSREIPDGLVQRRDRWREYVADKRILLILDDASDEAQVEPLLPNGARCLTVIASRRKLIGLEESEPLVLDAMTPDRAAELFHLRAGRDPAGTDPAAVAEIVRLCGYLPLPIVLIARRIAHRPQWTVTEACAELVAEQDRLGEFAVGPRALRAAFTMSYEDLPPRRQRLFRRLGLLPGRDIDKYAAAALDGIEVTDARRELEALFTDHLLHEQVQGRYRMHDLVRVYAAELAAGDPPRECRAAVDRLLAYYWQVGAVADRLLEVETRSNHPVPQHEPAAVPRLASRAQASAWLRSERDNLLDCLEYAAAHDRSAELLGLTGVVAGLLLSDGPWPTAIALHERAVERADSGDDPHAAADAHYNLGVMLYATGDYREATGPMRSAAARYGEIGRSTDRARALGILGALAYASGNYRSTDDLMRQALTIHREQGNRSAAAHAHLGVGMARYATGEYPEARRWVDDAVAMFTELADRPGVAYAHSRLGMVRHATGDYAGAVESLDRALGIYRDLEDPIGEAHTRNELASVWFATGDYPNAAGFAWQALEIFRDIGDRVGEAYALDNLGRLHYVTCEWPSAAEDMRRVQEIFTQIGDRVGEAYAIDDRSVALFTRGDFSGALERMAVALALFEQIGDRVGEAYTLFGLGLVHYASGDHTAAAGPMDRALAILGQIGDKVGRAYVLVALARLRMATGDNDAAPALLDEASEIFGGIGDPADERAVPSEGIGDRAGQAFVMLARARLHYAHEHNRAALAEVWRAVQLYEDLGDRFGQAYALGSLCVLQYVTGEHFDALASAEESVRIFDAIGDRACHAYAFVGLGLLRYAVGNQADALEQVRRSPAMFREIGDRIGEAYAFMGGSMLHGQSGDYPTMANWAQRGLSIFREIGENPRRAEVLERITGALEEASSPRDDIIAFVDALRTMRELQVRWRKRRVWRDLPVSATRW